MGIAEDSQTLFRIKNNNNPNIFVKPEIHCQPIPNLTNSCYCARNFSVNGEAYLMIKKKIMFFREWRSLLYNQMSLLKQKNLDKLLYKRNHEMKHPITIEESTEKHKYQLSTIHIAKQ